MNRIHNVTDNRATDNRATDKRAAKGCSVAILSEQLADKGRIWVLTGAGVSAASGIPTYRSHDGTWQHSRPIQHDEFVNQLSSRKRYWTRSLGGWEHIRRADPNAAHFAITALQKKWKLSQLVTQNVDRLHSIAGTQNVIDLHGRLDRVICLQCKNICTRSDYQIRLKDENPELLNRVVAVLPDGDAAIDEFDLGRVRIPPCDKCMGIMMPDVIFFGGSTPRNRVKQAFDSLNRSDCVLIVGSSLSVYSGFRFVKHAFEIALPIYAINQGVMRGEALIKHKNTEACEVVLPDLVGRL